MEPYRIRLDNAVLRPDGTVLVEFGRDEGVKAVQVAGELNGLLALLRSTSAPAARP